MWIFEKPDFSLQNYINLVALQNAPVTILATIAQFLISFTTLLQCYSCMGRLFLPILHSCLKTSTCNYDGYRTSESTVPCLASG